MQQSPPFGNRTRLLLQGSAASFRLSPFEVIVLVAVLAATMFGGYAAYASLTDLSAVPPTPPTYLPAFRTTLSSSVSTTGTVQSTQQVTLTFGATGKIKEFLVGLGKQVEAGQPLARLDDTELEQAVKSAQSGLDSALARLNAATEGPATTDVTTALQSLNTAKGQLATAQQSMVDLRARPTFTELATAQQGLLQAQNALQTANDNLVKAQAEAATAAIELASAQQTASERFAKLSNDHDALARAWSDCTAAPGVSKPAPPSPPAQGIQPLTASSFAAGTCTSTGAVTSYNNAVTAYNASGSAYGTSLSTLTTRQSAVTTAQTTLNSGNLQRAIQNSQLGLQVAQQKVSDAQAGPKPSEFEAAQRSIDSANASVESAVARYDALFEPAKPETVLPIQASVDQARAQLEAAKANLAGATIVAPFAGQISQVTGEVGSQVGANTAVFILLNPRLIRIDANVDQADITNLQAGQTASVTFDALTGRTYQATIAAIGLTPTVQQGVVTYVVTFAVDTGALPAATPVPAPGMTASLVVTTSRTEDALVVPTRSIRRAGRTSTVTVRTESGEEQRSVTTGATNGNLTQVLTGLTDGEEVLVSLGSAATTTTTAGRTTPGQFQGGGGQFTVPGGGAPVR